MDPNIKPKPDPTLDPVAQLTMAELDTGSRMIRGDLLAAVQPGHYLRSAAMAVVAYLLARREDPKAAKLATFRRMTLDELSAALGLVAPDGDQEDQAELDPDAADEALAAELLDVDPEAELAELDPEAELAAELAARPTVPGPG